MSKRMISLPGFKGVGEGPLGHFILETTLRELARAISELGVPVRIQELRAEIKAAEKLFRQRAVRFREPTRDDLCRLAAELILEAMLAQSKWCRQQTTFVQSGRK